MIIHIIISIEYFVDAIKDYTTASLGPKTQEFHSSSLGLTNTKYGQLYGAAPARFRNDR